MPYWEAELVLERILCEVYSMLAGPRNTTFLLCKYYVLIFNAYLGLFFNYLVYGSADPNYQDLEKKKYIF